MGTVHQDDARDGILDHVLERPPKFPGNGKEIGMKRSLVLIVAATLSLACGVPSLAGEWKQDEKGWWYDNGDSGWEHSGWKWIDGKCYYFTPEGYCLQNTTTPDGYSVNGDGAWTVAGVVQQKDAQGLSRVVEAGVGKTVQAGSLRIQTPEGFWQAGQEGNAYVYGNPEGTRAITVVSQSAEELAVFDQAEFAGMKMPVLDYAMTAALGSYTSRETVTLNTGEWVRYHYQDLSGQFGVPGTLTAYLRLCGTEIHMVVFAGDFSGTDTDTLMNTCIK